MKEISEKEYSVPWKRKRVKVSESSLRRWLSQYRLHGFKGLKPRDRRDKNISKAIDAITADQIIAIKRSDSGMSIPILIESMEASGKVPSGKLKHSTVHRLLQRHGLGGRSGRREGRNRQRLPYRYTYPMELWVGDVMHSRHPVQGRKAYLIAWMDNATRAIMHAEYRFSESALDILRTFRQALEVRGICKRVYVDHGSGYIDGRFVRTCAHLGIDLRYAPVRDGAAKGCIERYFGTLRRGFERYLQPGDIESLDRLNSLLWRWIHSTYHKRGHAGLGGESPWRRFMDLLPRIEHRRVESGFDFEGLWKTREHRIVRRDGVVRLKGHILEVPPTIKGRRVELRYIEEELPQGVEVWEEGYARGEASSVDLERNTRRRRWRSQSREEKAVRVPVDPLIRARKTWEEREKEE